MCPSYIPNNSPKGSKIYIQPKIIPNQTHLIPKSGGSSSKVIRAIFLISVATSDI